MRRFEKYRLKLALGILSFFLIGIFHKPVLEGLHFLSHLNDYSMGNYAIHGLESHKTDHQHFVINILNDQSNNTGQDLPNKQDKTKLINKLHQFSYQNETTINTSINKNELNFSSIFKLQFNFPKIPSPPPRS